MLSPIEILSASFVWHLHWRAVEPLRWALVAVKEFQGSTVDEREDERVVTNRPVKTTPEPSSGGEWRASACLLHESKSSLLGRMPTRSMGAAHQQFMTASQTRIRGKKPGLGREER
ncbi:hypothetical protein RRF57_009403 [Xylaria bambusicola]|uniref:Uncharacterized protein n=1 Tax=Xylaria bambusicola TaxID=326684 RepID=A0AAN7UZD5_9PEZI